STALTVFCPCPRPYKMYSRGLHKSPKARGMDKKCKNLRKTFGHDISFTYICIRKQGLIKFVTATVNL
ncbi:MAG: hypothetical protein IJ557_12505, partial [Bacteroidaceae bacterium]|nr:hypothetical protein [Bacteroidaceae bacterium]